jgi:hypothetical protein
MKPFTSKHCAQYLSKSSPCNQGEKIHTKPVKKETNLTENFGLLKPVDIQKMLPKMPNPPRTKREYIEKKQREKVKPVSVLKTNK